MARGPAQWGGAQRMSADHAGPLAGARLPVLLALVSAALYIVVASNLPLEVLAGAGHDDAWFWRRAQSIVDGHWMGRYDQMTLMKGSGYPLFLAASHALGLSVMTAQALLYAFACLLLGSAIHRVTGRPWLALLLLLAVQWHPAAMSWSRVLRDNIVAAQVLLLLAALVHVMHALRAGKRGWGWAALAGWTLAWLWLTREDGIWVVPGVLLLAMATAWQARGDARRQRTCVVAALAGLMACMVPLGLVATTNLVKYGIFVTNDFRGGAFNDAMAALQRVRVGDPVAYVPVPRKVREAVYAVSPAFARLGPYLEKDNQSWKRPPCTDLSHRAPGGEPCGDYAAGAWPWVLRSASASVGAYVDAPTAEAFYRQIALELGSACGEGRLECVGGVIDLMPAVTPAQWRTLPARLGKAASMLLWQGRRDGWGGGHLGTPAAFPMWTFVGRPAVLERPDRLGDRVAGWFHDPDGAWIALACDGADRTTAVPRVPSPDVAAHFGDRAAHSSRFAVVVPAPGDCAFESTAGAGRVRLADVSDARRGFTLGSGRLQIDAVRLGIPPSAQAHPTPRRLRAGISRLHATLLPWLGGVGLVAFAWLSVHAIRQRRIDLPWLLAAAAWTLIGARMALLILVDISAFPALHIHYVQPVFPLLSLAAWLSIALLVQGGIRWPGAAGRQRL